MITMTVSELVAMFKFSVPADFGHAGQLDAAIVCNNSISERPTACVGGPRLVSADRAPLPTFPSAMALQSLLFAFV